MRLFSTKSLSLMVLLALLPAMIFAQGTAFGEYFKDAPAEEKTIVASAEDLIAQGKWLSAWNLLADATKDKANPWILAEQIRVALDGYAQTSLHVVFGFVDLKEGQDLEMVRNEEGTELQPFEFDPYRIASELEAAGEAMPPVLSMMLGKYYYTVWNEYKDQWVQDQTAVLDGAASNYERAFAYEMYTRETLQEQADVLTTLEQFKGAEKVLLKAIELDPAHMGLKLKLAETYYSMQDDERALIEADKVIAEPEDNNQLNDAYIVAIKSGLDLQDETILEKYVAGFEASFPSEFVPGLVRHLVAVRLGNAEAANTAADKVTAAFPGSPDVVRSILSTWLNANDAESGFKYLERTIAKGQGDDTMAILYFYKALLTAEVAESADVLKGALEDLATAEQYFQKSYPEGHQVFGVIKDLQQQWNDALVQSSATEQKPETDASSAATDSGSYEESAPAPAEYDATSGATE